MQDDDAAARLEAIRRFYDGEYYRDVPPRARPSAHHRRLALRLAVGVQDAVLDVACGTGGWLAACAERGAAVAGIDLSARAIECCRASLRGGEFHVGPAETLPFEDERFSIVTCLGSLEHFLDPDAALGAMRRVAQDDARFIILVPNAGFLTRRLGLFRGTYQTQAREQVLSLAAWQALFERNGLRVVARWRDLHVLSRDWILRPPWSRVPARAAQALALACWPLGWQYQVYFECRQTG
ncbi:MAG: class I SAM-dependent methyltransferase [Gammaproteobacteria bacterium]|nr:class I SAM-dependent methyltransferase [Gammaproteobacteria bacterium]MCP5198526.1 class I SAM-dependent methyltransferase [Gammaproteobacteria bacterium]